GSGRQRRSDLAAYFAECRNGRRHDKQPRCKRQPAGAAGLVSTGGGPSKYESRPSYQSAISQNVGSKRGTPDVAADADPNTGVWVYNVPYCDGWCIVGGTSAAAPVWAGIVNAAGRFSASSQAELSTMYSNLGKAADC